MENAVFIFDSHDIPAAVAIFRNLPDGRSYVFDPALLDKAIESGMVNCEFVEWAGCFEYPTLRRWAKSAAFEIEKKLDQSVREIVPEVSIFGWQHYNLYYFLMATQWYSGLWAEVAPRFAGHKIHVPVCDNSSHYYWPSYIPPLLLLQQLKALDIEFSAYNYGVREEDTHVVPDLRQPVADSFDVLSYLPTCFYDISYFNDELKASGKSVINFQSKYKAWDVPVAAQQTVGLSTLEEQLANLPEQVRQRAEAFFERLVSNLDTLFAPYVATPDYRAREAIHIAGLYKSQFITYHLLGAYFRQARPSKMLLSDHDASFHGPLLAYAEAENIPILFVPHSKTMDDMQFGRNTVTCLTHPIQGEPIDDAHGQRVNSLKLAYPEHFEGSSIVLRPLKRVGLLLNAVSLSGVFVTSYAAYMAGIVRIVDWCRARDIELVIRGRPGYTMIAMLAQATGIAVSTLQEGMSRSLGAFAADQDLCLMYDAPTTGEIDFLRNSVPILNPVPEPLAKYEAVIANVSVIPRNSVEETLVKLDSFIADPANFHAFRLSQFGNYINLFQGAQALRTLL